MKTSVIIWAVVVVVLLGGGWYWYSISNNGAAVATFDQSANQNLSGTPTTTTQTAPMNVTVTYGPGGFNPSTVTIAKGGTVNWVAAPGADELWVASNPHPTHQGYDGTTKDQHCAAAYAGPTPFDECKTGTAYSFTFNTAGTWGYHNHGNHSDTGVVIVQ